MNGDDQVGSTASDDLGATDRIVTALRRGPITRTELIQRTRLTRRVLDARLEPLTRAGLVCDSRTAPSNGGRPARLVELRADAGAVGAILMGASELTIATMSLTGRVTARHHEEWDMGSGPGETFERAVDLLQALSQSTTTLWGIGMGVAAPVDPHSHTITRHRHLPSWQGVAPAEWVARRTGLHSWVDNDVNLMARAETSNAPDAHDADLLFVKLGSSIDSGIVLGGQVVHGRHGGAGDISHVTVAKGGDEQCVCGRRDCLDVIASGRAILRRITAVAGRSAALSARRTGDARLALADIAAAVASGDPTATDICGSAIDAVAAIAAERAAFLDVDTIVFGGGFLTLGDWAVRRFSDAVRRANQLTRRSELTVRAAAHGLDAGIRGAGQLALDHVLTAAALARRGPARAGRTAGTATGHRVPAVTGV